MKTELFALTRDGKTLFEGMQDSCYLKLQRMQSNSANWAIKHEGYKISPIEVTPEREKEILAADPFRYIQCYLLEPLNLGRGNHTVRVQPSGTGETMYASTYAMRYEGMNEGDKVFVMQYYLTQK